MHCIILKFVTDVQKNKNGAGQAKGEAKHIQEAKEFLPAKIADGNKDVVADHTMGVGLQYQRINQ